MRRSAFWMKIHKRSDGCWDWLGHMYNGAPKFGTLIDGRPRSFKATRYAWEHLVGPIPAGQCVVRIVCWNARCVNPAHSELMPHGHIRKWLQAAGRPFEYADQAGGWSASAKLTTDAVREIRSYRGVRGGTTELLAKLFGVSSSTISHVMCGVGWPGIRGASGVAMPLEKLRELVEQRGGGMNITDLNNHYTRGVLTRINRFGMKIRNEQTTFKTGVA